MGDVEVLPVAGSRAHRLLPLRRSVVVAVIVAIATVPVATASTRAEHDSFTGPGAEYYGYFPSEITIAKGDTILYTNYDFAPHDFVQDVETDGFGGKPNVPWCKEENHDDGDHHHGCPVFWSKQIGNQQQTSVRGLNRVKPGTTYTFFCTLHHGMKGTLTVTE